MWRKEDREIPLEPELEYIGAGTHRIIGPYGYRPVFTGTMVKPRKISSVITSIYYFRIRGSATT